MDSRLARLYSFLNLLHPLKKRGGRGKNQAEGHSDSSGNSPRVSTVGRSSSPIPSHNSQGLSYFPSSSSFPYAHPLHVTHICAPLHILRQVLSPKTPEWGGTWLLCLTHWWTPVEAADCHIPLKTCRVSLRGPGGPDLSPGGRLDHKGP